MSEVSAASDVVVETTFPKYSLRLMFEESSTRQRYYLVRRRKDKEDLAKVSDDALEKLFEVSYRFMTLDELLNSENFNPAMYGIRFKKERNLPEWW